MIYNSIQLNTFNPPKYKEESTPHGKLLIEKRGFEIRDLFKHINSILVLLCTELKQKLDLKLNRNHYEEIIRSS